ncbi:MAG: DUF5722 domain-containing protein [Pirellulaceae bacterium]|nr:DUF5722 domain-containing protein [Pirellulaceae bacterium]
MASDLNFYVAFWKTIHSFCSHLCYTCLACFFFTSSLAAAEPSASTEKYPQAASKKGLQVEIIDDALALGVKHAALNVNLSQLIDPNIDRADDRPSWQTPDRIYYFKRAYLNSLDRNIKALSDQDVIVNLIILVSHTGDASVDRLMIHPQYDPKAPNRLGAFNAETVEGQQWLSATMEFLANRWSRPDQQFGRVAGYILGNEVNSHWWWSNMGHVTMQEFANNYLAATRLAHAAIRRHNAWARVYISLEHHWNIYFPSGAASQAFAGKPFLDYFAQQARAGGDFDWHVAFHPYPENLFEPRFWNDKTALPKADTPRITFKNLEVLTSYLRRAELRYAQQPRRVILSEQGFHTPDGDDGERVQAAAYCYAYKKVEALPGIDAFILHRHVDHPHEGGLRLGLRRFQPSEKDPRPPKLIYNCFRVADTPDWEAAFEFALPIVGRDDW